MFGRGIVRRSPEPGRQRAGGIDRPSRQVEIQEHRLAIARQEHIRRLDVHVHQAPVMGVLEAVGEAGTDPGDGLDVPGPGERPAVGPLVGEADRQGLLGLVERLDQLLPGSSLERTIAEQFQEPGQGRSPQIRHAEDPQVPGRQHLLGVEWHDVHVLKTCQREMFLLRAGRDLEDHGPGGQGVLRGEEDPPRRPPSELGQESEPAQDLAHSRKGHGGPLRLHQALAVEQDFELRPPPRESVHDLGRDDLEPRFLTKANLFIDQPQCRLGAQLGMAVKERLGPRLLSPPPRGDHFSDELRRERRGAGDRNPGRKVLPWARRPGIRAHRRPGR